MSTSQQAWSSVSETSTLSLDSTSPGSSVTMVNQQKNEAAQDAVHRAGLSDLSDNLRQQCDMMILFSPLPDDGRVYCNATFDGWGCWPYTMAGATARIPCTETIFHMHTSHTAMATKKCEEDGVWFVQPSTNRTYSNYTACSLRVEEKHFIPIYIFLGGYSLSLIMLVVSLAIFMAFSQLRCERITVHKNLFISYILAGVVWILYFVFVTLDGDVQRLNPIWCQVLHVMTQYGTTCNFAWMFCEGLYLHVIMAHTFRTGKLLVKALLFVGWGSPLLLTIIYAIARGITHSKTEACWRSEDALQWINYAPVVVSVVVNILILVNLVRLLVTKLRQVPDAPQSRKAVRATLILAPLLGLQFLLFPVRPEQGIMLDVYTYLVAVITSLQGALVSVMYCFCNSEVTAVIRRKWTQHQLMKGHVSRKTTALTSLSYSEGYSMVHTHARSDHPGHPGQKSKVAPDIHNTVSPQDCSEVKPLKMESCET